MATSVPPAPATVPAPAPATASGDQAQFVNDLATKVAKLITKNNGDPSEAIELVMTENAKYRERHRNDEATIAQLRGQLPKEGEVVLPKADADLLAEVKKFPELADKSKLKTYVEEHSKLITDKAQQDAAEQHKKMASAVGYDPEMLPEIIKYKEWHVESKKVTIPDPADKSGKTFKEVEVPHVRPKNNPTATLEPLTVAAERDLSKPMFEALRKAPTSTGKQDSTATGGRPVAAFPSQSVATGTKGASSGSDVASSYVGRMYEDPTAPKDKKE